VAPSCIISSLSEVKPQRHTLRAASSQPASRAALEELETGLLPKCTEKQGRQQGCPKNVDKQARWIFWKTHSVQC